MTLSLRKATIDDGQQLFDWVNSPSSLDNKGKTQGAIPWDEHIAWFNKRLDNPDVGIWMIESGQSAVGQTRVERENDQLIVDIFIQQKSRGKGYGVLALALLQQEAKKRWPGLVMVAEIKESNQASIALFAKAGYNKLKSDQGFCILEKT